MSFDHKQQLESQLWNIANTLRGKMGADDFRDYILGFIFYKYLSERMHLFADKILKNDGITFDAIDESSAEGKEMLAAIQEEAIGRLGYFLKPSELFSKVAERGGQKSDNFILEDLTSILKHIESSTMGHDSEEDFEGLFEDLDLGSSKLGKSENQKNELIAKVLVHLDEIDFELEDTEADVLGDAYEYLIGQFASGAGKKAGEFYTPQEVSTILAKIVTTGKNSLKSVYDPTCGSGSLLLRVAKEVEEVGGFYGQEMNPTTYNLARMNMILHGVHYQRFDLRNEDTLENPAPEHAELRFEAIVANPPFSANWSASTIHENDDRFSAYGKLAPKTKADFAFVQHMVHHLDSGATMAVVLPHAALFRGGAEKHIRTHLIEDLNIVDAVIGLPANIFFGTDKPTCIMVLKKQRVQTDDVLFIDASLEFEKVDKQNTLSRENIHRIVDGYRKRENHEKFSYAASLSEVLQNECNLNIPRYIENIQKEEPVGLSVISKRLVSLREKMRETDKVLATFCKELGIPPPMGDNISLLAEYKVGVRQQLFHQTIRFKDKLGRDFPDWEKRQLGEVLFEHKQKSTGEEAVYSVSVHKGLVNQVEHLGRSYSAESTDHYNRVNPGDVVYTKSPTGDFPLGIIKQSHATMSVIVSPLYAVFKPESPGLGRLLEVYFESSANVHNYLYSLIQKGVKNTFSINNETFLSKRLLLPVAEQEQRMIGAFFTEIDKKIESISN